MKCLQCRHGRHLCCLSQNFARLSPVLFILPFHTHEIYFLCMSGDVFINFGKAKIVSLNTVKDSQRQYTSPLYFFNFNCCNNLIALKTHYRNFVYKWTTLESLTSSENKWDTNCCFFVTDVIIYLLMFQYWITM